MTITSTTSKVTFAGNGATTVFTYSFPIPNADSVVAIYTNASGTETTLSPSQYTITGLGDAEGGTITYPTSGSPIASGTSLTLQRVVPLVQETELENQGGYYPEVVEDALDYLTMAVQQISGTSERAITGSATDPDGLSYTLPSVDDRADRFLYFDADGNVAVAAGVADDAVVISSAMEPVVGAASTALAAAAMGVLPTSGGTVTGNMSFEGDVEVDGTFTVAGQALVNDFPFSVTRQWAAISDGTYVLGEVPYAFEVDACRYNVGSGGGSFTLAVQIAGVSIGGISAVAVSSSTTATATATSANTGVQWGLLTAVISSTTGSPVNAWINVRGSRVTT